MHDYIFRLEDSWRYTTTHKLHKNNFTGNAVLNIKAILN